MGTSEKPKRALIAYCVLAEKLRTPGQGIMQALTPFLAEACQQFAGELFDASKFSDAVLDRYGIRIPRLAALGLAEQLAINGLLTPLSNHSTSIVYKYTKQETPETAADYPVTEAEIEAVLQSIVVYCRTDNRLEAWDNAKLQAAFLDRLLNVDSMRLLVRREASIAAKKTADTLIIQKPLKAAEQPDKGELHFDFLVSQFLLDLRDKNYTAFERVSNVAFANMAAEAIACFQEPATAEKSLAGLTVYLDSPLLLDMLGVNIEYTDYGMELLGAIKTSGAKAAVFDHCIAEADTAIYGQLAYLRSGINQFSANWGTSAKPDLLSALVGNVGERAEQRLGIEVHRDPEVNLHRKSQTTVGDIESEITRRMQAWRNMEAKEYDRKSVWAMLAIRDTTAPCPRICDSQWLLLTRNTPLVGIANDSWVTWLKGATKHSHTHIERWAPVAMSDKQFAGYLWARTGGGDGSISRARLLAHCSAAVRPRADVKARAYNLVLELSGSQAAEDVAALLEDREGARALMRVTKGDPEDVTRERLPFILEKVKLAAGEFAAATVRAESEQREAEIRSAHDDQLERIRCEAAAAQAVVDSRARETQTENLQHHQQLQAVNAQNEELQRNIAAQDETEAARKTRILQAGLKAGASLYLRLRWYAALLFGIVSWLIVMFSTVDPFIAAGLSGLIAVVGFWFVPDYLDNPINWFAMKHLQTVVHEIDATLEIPTQSPDFKEGTWDAIQ
jgi:hypothetical protein